MCLPIFITTKDDHSLSAGLELTFQKVRKVAQTGSPSPTKNHPCKKKRSKKPFRTRLHVANDNTLHC